MSEEKILELAPRLRNLTSRQMNGRFTAPTRKLLRKLREGNKEPHIIVNEHLANLRPVEKETILRELEEHAARIEKQRTVLEEIRESRVVDELRDFVSRLRPIALK